MISGVAEMLHDGAVGLQEATGGVKLFDVRFELGRILIKSLPKMFMVVLCQPTINVQLLFISLNIAIKKLEKLPLEQLLEQPSRPAAPVLQAPQQVDARRPLPATPAYSDYRALTDAKGVLLTCEIMKKTASTFWDSMTDSASVNRNTALEISNFFNTGPFRKLTITNRATGAGKHIPVNVIQHDRDHAYDGKLVVTLAVAELLKVKEGDQLRVEVVVGGGILGWEGI